MARYTQVQRSRVDDSAEVQQLVEMGFAETHALAALEAQGTVHNAADWLLQGNAAHIPIGEEGVTEGVTATTDTVAAPEPELELGPVGWFALDIQQPSRFSRDSSTANPSETDVRFVFPTPQLLPAGAKESLPSFAPGQLVQARPCLSHPQWLKLSPEGGGCGGSDDGGGGSSATETEKPAGWVLRQSQPSFSGQLLVRSSGSKNEWQSHWCTMNNGMLSWFAPTHPRSLWDELVLAQLTDESVASAPSHASRRAKSQWFSTLRHARQESLLMEPMLAKLFTKLLGAPLKKKVLAAAMRDMGEPASPDKSKHSLLLSCR
jgi:hypothetical protein